MPPPTFSSDPPGTLTFTVRVSTMDELKREVALRVGAFWPSTEALTILGDSVEWTGRCSSGRPDANGFYTWTVDVYYRTRERPF